MNEFKKIIKNNETHYVLEDASASATGAGAVALVASTLGPVRRRIKKLKEKIETIKVKQLPPRKGAPKPQTGAGAHRDKKKEQKQGQEKHRKPFYEQLVAELEQLTNTMKEIREPSDWDLARSAERERRREIGQEQEPRYNRDMEFVKFTLYNGLTKKYLSKDGVISTFNGLSHALNVRKKLRNPDDWTAIPAEGQGLEERSVNEFAPSDEQGVAEGSSQNLVYISKNKVREFEEWMESEGLETEVPKKDIGKFIVYDYSGQDVTTKSYADDWNEKPEQGVAEGDGSWKNLGLSGEVNPQMGPRLKEIRDFVERFALHNEKNDYIDMITDLAGFKNLGDMLRKSDGSIDNTTYNEIERMTSELERLGFTIASDWKNEKYMEEPRISEFAKIKKEWYLLFKKAINFATTYQTQQGVAEGDDFDHGEYNDEAGMVKNNIHTIMRVMSHLEKAIKDNENIPEWCQEKIAVAKSMLVGVMDYMISQYEMGMQPELSEEKIKGVDGKACWPGKRYAGRKRKPDGTYKDICVPVKEDSYINSLENKLNQKLKK